MRILIITDMPPYPPVSGTPLRTYNLLRRIGREHQVWLATFVGTPEEAAGLSQLGEFCRGLEAVAAQHLGALARPLDALRYLRAGKPPELRLYYSQELAGRIRDLASKVAFDAVEIVNSYMAPYIEALPRAMQHRTIVTFIDIVFSKYGRIARLEPRLARRWRTWLYSRMMERWEPRYVERFGRCITMSEVDRCLLLKANPRLKVSVIPNGVDVQVNRPLPQDGCALALVFVGNMDYLPCADAVIFFCRDVLPLVRRAIPNVEMWIVGLNPPPEVARLDGPGVHVTGRVDDVRPYYGRSTACVVPLRAGGGTRLKILEAMALGRPVVSTSIGCEGLDVVDEEHLLVADTPGQFAERVTRVLTDRALRESIVVKARQLVESRYDWDVVARNLAQVYAGVAG